MPYSILNELSMGMLTAVYPGMSQAGVKVLTKKHAHPDNNGGPSSPLSRGKIGRPALPSPSNETEC